MAFLKWSLVTWVGSGSGLGSALGLGLGSGLGLGYERRAWLAPVLRTVLRTPRSL